MATGQQTAQIVQPQLDPGNPAKNLSDTVGLELEQAVYRGFQKLQRVTAGLGNLVNQT